MIHVPNWLSSAIFDVAAIPLLFSFRVLETIDSRDATLTIDIMFSGVRKDTEVSES